MMLFQTVVKKSCGIVDTFCCCCRVCCDCCCPANEDGEGLNLDSWATAPYRLLFVYPDSIVSKVGRFTDDPQEAVLSNNLALKVIYYRRQLGVSKDWSIVYYGIADAHTIVQNV